MVYLKQEKFLDKEKQKLNKKMFNLANKELKRIYPKIKIALKFSNN